MAGEGFTQPSWLLFDWGDTLMMDNPSAEGPMALWPEVRIVPGALQVLTELKPRYHLGLATNAAASDESQIWAALRRVNLDSLIEKIFCYRGVGHKKPSPEFFAFVLKDLGVGVNRVVMVGDSFEADVAGANQAGLRAIWLNQHSNVIRSGTMHRTILKLTDLPRALSEFMG